MDLQKYKPIFLIFFIIFLPASNPANLLESGMGEQLNFVYDSAQFRTGDIIFRRGDSMVSHFIMTTDADSPYSHVGMIKKIKNRVFVIHVVPDRDKDNVVSIEPIENFLAIQNASAVAVYRLKDDSKDYALHAVNVASTFVRERLPFDFDFDLQTPDYLYCTELVWRAYREVGIDLVDGQFVNLTFPLSKGPYLLPSQLLESHYLSLVFASDIK